LGKPELELAIGNISADGILDRKHRGSYDQ
jgi:hypothetical protein